MTKQSTTVDSPTSIQSVMSPLTEYGGVAEFMGDRLADTEFRFARFDFPIEKSDPDPGTAGTVWEDVERDGHSIWALAHPKKGVVLFDIANNYADSAPMHPTAEIAPRYGNLMARRMVLEEALPDETVFRHRSLALGEAVIVPRDDFEEPLLPSQVPNEAIIWEDELSIFPGCFDKAFDFYRQLAATPVSEYAEPLIEALFETTEAEVTADTQMTLGSQG